jgi:ribonuclease PH
VQGTAEHEAFTREQMDGLLALAERGIGELLEAQRAALGRATAT